MKKHIDLFLLKLGIIAEFMNALWKFKLWWGIPIVFLIFILMILLLAGGHTGGAALIYPLF